MAQAARPHLEAGTLLSLHPDVTIDVALFWHQWKLGPAVEAEAPGAPTARSGLLEQIGQALSLGARSALLAPL